jgi:hypothetical protein
VLSAFTTFIISFVSLLTALLSAAFWISERKAFRKTFPALPALPNSCPFSLVLWKAGSVAICSAVGPLFLQAKLTEFGFKESNISDSTFQFNDSFLFCHDVQFLGVQKSRFKMHLVMTVLALVLSPFEYKVTPA